MKGRPQDSRPGEANLHDTMACRGATPLQNTGAAAARQPGGAVGSARMSGAMASLRSRGNSAGSEQFLPC